MISYLFLFALRACAVCVCALLPFLPRSHRVPYAAARAPALRARATTFPHPITLLPVPTYLGLVQVVPPTRPHYAVPLFTILVLVTLYRAAHCRAFGWFCFALLLPPLTPYILYYRRHFLRLLPFCFYYFAFYHFAVPGYHRFTFDVDSTLLLCFFFLRFCYATFDCGSPPRWDPRFFFTLFG